MILIQQSTSNTQLWSLLRSIVYMMCITSHTNSKEAASHMEAYNAAHFYPREKVR